MRIGIVSLSEKLLDIVACPQCKGKLTYEEDDERLVCVSCRLAFRVEGGIPVLLLDEAEKL